MHIYVDIHTTHTSRDLDTMTTEMATGLLSLYALSNMVRGSLLLLGWILEQPQS